MDADVVEMVADVVLTRLEYEEHACIGRGVSIWGEVVGHTVFVEAVFFRPYLFHLIHVRGCYRTTFRLGDD